MAVLTLQTWCRPPTAFDHAPSSVPDQGVVHFAALPPDERRTQAERPDVHGHTNKSLLSYNTPEHTLAVAPATARMMAKPSPSRGHSRLDVPRPHLISTNHVLSGTRALAL